MKKVVISAVMATALSVSLNAGDLDLMVGKNFFDSDTKLDDALSYGLRYNHYYQNSPWGVQIGYDRVNNADIEAVGQTGSVDLNRYTLNALYELSSSDNFKTFLLGGLGYEDVSKSYASLDSQMFLDAGIGARYKLNEFISLVGEAKYIRKLDDNLNDFVVSLGLGYSFGEGAAKPAPVAMVKDTEPSKPSYKIEPKQPEPAPVKEEPKDSDGDGVFDNFDMCANTYAGTKVDKNGCPVMMELHINFDTDKSDVKSIYENQIDKAVNAMKIMPWVRATVVGHTDSVGTDAYNQKLSERRAASVKAEMIKRGNLKDDRINAVGKGEKQPIASNKTEEGRADNRRVEVTFE